MCLLARTLVVGLLTLAIGAAQTGPRPSIQSVVDGAQFQPDALAPGMIVTVFGTGLAAERAAAASLPLPLRLSDTTVTVGGLPAPLFYTSPEQVNLLVPYGVAPGPAKIEIARPGGSASADVEVVPVRPFFFATGSHPDLKALYFSPDFSTVAPELKPGDAFVAYVNGLGLVDPVPAAGAGGSGIDPLNRTVAVPQVDVGGHPATVEYAGLAPGLAGVYQLNVRLGPEPFTKPVMRVAAGGVSDPMPVRVARHALTALDASMEVLYPTADTVVTWAPVPVVVRWGIRATLSGNGAPFTVVLPCGEVVVEPAKKTWSGRVCVPGARAAMGQFATTWDFLASTSERIGFPGNVVPPRRFDPAATRLLSMFPMPNDAAAAPENSAWFAVSGELDDSGAFTIGPDSHPELSTFVLYDLAWPGTRDSLTRPLTMYVEGRKAAEAAYTIRVR